MQYPYDYIKNEVAIEFSRILQLPDFYDEKSWNGIALDEEAINLLKQDRSKLNPVKLFRLNCLLLYSAYSEYMLNIDEWGDGVSIKMLKQFQNTGFDRMMLCTDGWSAIEKKPEVAIEADKMGYLLGTYEIGLIFI